MVQSWDRSCGQLWGLLWDKFCSGVNLVVGHGVGHGVDHAAVHWDFHVMGGHGLAKIILLPGYSWQKKKRKNC